MKIEDLEQKSCNITINFRPHVKDNSRRVFLQKKKKAIFDGENDDDDDDDNDNDINDSVIMIMIMIMMMMNC